MLSLLCLAGGAGSASHHWRWQRENSRILARNPALGLSLLAIVERKRSCSECLKTTCSKQRYLVWQKVALRRRAIGRIQPDRNSCCRHDEDRGIWHLPSLALVARKLAYSNAKLGARLPQPVSDQGKKTIVWQLSSKNDVDQAELPGVAESSPAEKSDRRDSSQ